MVVSCGIEKCRWHLMAIVSALGMECAQNEPMGCSKLNGNLKKEKKANDGSLRSSAGVRVQQQHREAAKSYS